MLKIISTSDGSKTVYVPELDEHYHSTFGAVSESLHIFIGYGYKSVATDPVNILEFGFGTGLNALLTLHESLNDGRQVNYVSIEKYPLEAGIYKQLDYSKFLPGGKKSYFKLLHECPWEEKCMISDNFSLLKTEKDFRDIEMDSIFDIIYFDAFAPAKQPDLWTADMLSLVSGLIKQGGIFVTYSAKGQLRRELTKLGFRVEHPPGPAGKRQITRAVKTV